MSMVWATTDMHNNSVKFVKSVWVLCVVGGIKKSQMIRVYNTMEKLLESLEVLSVLESF